jgi:carbon storage regulator
MLILTRRVGEAIHIGADIEVVILGVKGNQIRVGTRAPIEVAVHRAEIFKQIQGRANFSAPSSSAPPRGPHQR